MVMAAVAYRDLQAQQRPVLDAVVVLLRQHPDFPARWAPRLQEVPEEDQPLVLFMLAARWPDDIRGHPAWDHPTQHFIDVPFIPPGQPAAVTGVDPNPHNIVTSFAAHQHVLRDRATGQATTPDKAVALSWIFHQMGGVHQPLHTITLLTADYPPPEGDRGGTRFYIRATPGAHTLSLHTLWDDVILGSENVQTVRNRAHTLSLRPDLAHRTFPELAAHDVDGWARASFTLAATMAYREGHLAGTKDRAHRAVLPEDYLSQCQALAERQLVLAGDRLADWLIGTFAP